MTLTPSALAAVSLPTRTAWKYGLVRFLVNTAIVSPSANAELENSAVTTAVTPMTKVFMLVYSLLILSFAGLCEELAGFHAAFIPLPGGGSAAPELRRGDIGAPGTNLSPDR